MFANAGTVRGAPSLLAAPAQEMLKLLALAALVAFRHLVGFRSQQKNHGI
jgi:hypothetical protein